MSAVEDLLALPETDVVLAHNLLIVCGSLGSERIQARMLLWLEDPRFRNLEDQILVGLNQAPLASRRSIESAYRQFTRADAADLPIRLPGMIMPSRNPAVLERTLERLQKGRSALVQKTASAILAGIVQNSSLVSTVSPMLLKDLRATFVEILRTSPHVGMRVDAAQFIGSLPDLNDADLVSALNFALDDASFPRGQRPVLAAALAGRARTVEDFSHVIQRVSEEHDAAMRSAFVIGLDPDAIRDKAARAVLAERIGAVASRETVESVKLRCLDILLGLRPDADPYLEWALTDPSETVRLKARKALKRE